MLRPVSSMFMFVAAGILLSGCASYMVPGAAADLRVFGLSAEAQRDRTEPGIQRVLDRKPAASFPVRLAIVRVQAAGYHSHSSSGYGHGNYSVITARDVETDEDIRTIENLPRIDGVAPINRLLVPASLNSDRELRQAAAAVQADMLLLYTFDTRFETDDAMRPLTVVSLGLFPTKNVRVGTTASALLMDTRTGYIYAVAEASEDADQIANAWTSSDAADQVRRRTERDAFSKLITSFAGAWHGVVASYDPAAATARAATPASAPAAH